MKKIPLTRGECALVDDEDFGWLNQWKWSVASWPTNHKRYAHRKKYLGGGRANQQSRHISMHRLIMEAGDGQEIDHIDGNGLNNQRDNLRFCSHLQNCRNQKKQVNWVSSKYKGVHWHKGGKSWRVQIKICGKQKHIGYFQSEIQAAKTYDKIAYQYFGKFARLNFPNGGGKDEADGVAQSNQR